MFLMWLLYPSEITRFFLVKPPEINEHIKLLTQLYGVLGFVICLQLFLEPVLSRRSSLLHGLLGCALTMIIIIHRSLVQPISLYFTVYFALCGIYLIIKAPSAIKIHVDKEQAQEQLKAPEKRS